VDFQEAFRVESTPNIVVGSTRHDSQRRLRLRRARRRFAVLVAVVLLCAVVATPDSVAAADPASDEKDDLAETRDERRRLGDELADLEASDTQLEAYLIALDEELVLALAAVAEAERNVLWASGHVDLATARLETSGRILAQAEAGVRAGALTAYVQAPDDLLNASVLADNAADASRRLTLVGVVLSGRQARVMELREARQLVAGEHLVATDIAALAERTLMELGSAREHLQDTREAHERTRLEAQARIEEVRAEVDALEAEERELEALIRRLQLDAIRSAGVAPDILYRPTSGWISSEYGPRWGRNHNGLDFAASTGTGVVAAAPGFVSHAGPYGSFGNLVMVEHGGGLTTLYAHLDVVSVREGARVDVGERIGSVGSTGRSTGPHLHFEVRQHGAAVNPRNLLLW
jgi:murein DD-endopeptidase MepM/ murein hydrolase activator NlpD